MHTEKSQIRQNVYENEPVRRHTGLWIPVELSQLGLSPQEQFLLATIDALDQGYPYHCTISNRRLAELMDLSEKRVSHYITQLKRKELIQEISFTGRVRTLKSLKHNWYKPEKRKNSKKELCSFSSRQTTRFRAVHSNNIDNITSSSLPPPGKPGLKSKEIQKKFPHPDNPDLDKPKRESLRSEEEIFESLKELPLKPSEKKRLMQYGRERVDKAVNSTRHIKPKKGLMALLMHALHNPNHYIEPEQKQLSDNTKLVINHLNALLVEENKLLKIDILKNEILFPCNLNAEGILYKKKIDNSLLENPNYLESLENEVYMFLDIQKRRQTVIISIEII